VFGLSAAVAVFLDIGIRVYMFFVSRIITSFCGNPAIADSQRDEVVGLMDEHKEQTSLEDRILGAESEDDI